MCGIAGFIYKNKITNANGRLQSMLDKIPHRGPDGEGIKVFDDCIGLGHRRLSILDLSDNSSQPMSYDDENLWITYNGEVYNYIEIRNELRNLGYSFRSDSDTEVILAAYQQWGENCVSKFNGMWAYAIFDRAKNVMFCSRDRFGVKPFYYYRDNDSLCFGSEIKELIENRGVAPRANYNKLEAYLIEGIIEGDEETMFQGIFKLKPGHNLTIDCKTLDIRLQHWYKLEDKSNRTIPWQAKTREQFKNLFQNSVKLRLRSDVPVGMCLSGGLDSSSIVCMVKNINPDSEIHTITSCFEDIRFDEYEYADEVNKKVSAISHRAFPDINKAFDKLDKIIWHMDEPFAGMSMYAQWEVFSEAKNNGLKVMLDGQGADEQLAGYIPFYDVLYIDLLKKFKINKFIKEWKFFQENNGGKALIIGAIKKFFVCISISLMPIRMKYRALVASKKKSFPLAAGWESNTYVKKQFCAYDKRNVKKYIQANMMFGMQNLLHYEDRNSMAHSIEARVPFLDKELVEYVYDVPMEEKIVGGRTKNVLREGVKDILPQRIYNRTDKMGFVTPQNEWMKENKEYVRKELTIACEKLNRFVDRDRVLSWFDKFEDTREGKYEFCFRMICASRWLDVFKVTV